ncbi:hypothetical protein MMC30_003701 [Trapelia coarctata]|nr:hypothetical protein [Trapelia coarctata]
MANVASFLMTQRPRRANSTKDPREQQRSSPQDKTIYRGKSIRQLWPGALELLASGERDWQQRLPQDLVDEEQLHGYEHIRALLSMRPTTGGKASFLELTRPFLMVITHPALLDCLSVDNHVGDLYTFISGSGGNRAIPFFQSLVNSLSDERLKALNTHESPGEDTLVALATALREVLRRTPKALYHEDLPALAESISKAIGRKRDSVAIHTVVERVAELQRMIYRAQGVLGRDTDDIEEGGIILQSVITSTYPRDIQLPGDRHDNDKRDITDIDVIPTEGEVRSERPEFLPSPNTDQPHYLHGIERLLDTHFRLLRHDIFGELKSVLGGMLKARDDD